MMSLPNLPVTVRVLFSSFLIMIGVGYLMALSYLFLVDVKPGRDVGERMVQSIGEKYHGSSDTRLEEALRGTMADKLTAEERDRVFEWIDAGATRNGYAKVEHLFTQKCVPCHSAQSGLPIPSLGALMGLALACQIFISLWDMWIVPLTASAQAKSQKGQGTAST
jgi:hypothetical protein